MPADEAPLSLDPDPAEASRSGELGLRNRLSRSCLRTASAEAKLWEIIRVQGGVSDPGPSVSMLDGLGSGRDGTALLTESCVDCVDGRPEITRVDDTAVARHDARVVVGRTSTECL